MVVADAEHRRFTRPIPLDPGIELSAIGSYEGLVGWQCNRWDLMRVVPHGESPDIAINLDRPWIEPWPKLTGGSAHYLASAGQSSYFFGAWTFSPVQIVPVISLEAGRHYGGSIRIYGAPSPDAITVQVKRFMCQADVDAGGLLLSQFALEEWDGEPFPIEKWRRIEIPTALCDADDLPGIRICLDGDALPYQAGAIGIDNFVLTDASPGPRRTEL